MRILVFPTRERQRQRDRQRQKDRETERDRETEKQRDRETERQRETEILYPQINLDKALMSLILTS